MGRGGVTGRVGKGGDVARLVRENGVLRKACAAAARLRRIGLACDRIEEAAEEFWAANPHVGRSLTGALMARTAYDEALKAFDAALLDAADIFARDPFAEDLALGPHVSSLQPAEGEG